MHVGKYFTYIQLFLLDLPVYLTTSGLRNPRPCQFIRIMRAKIALKDDFLIVSAPFLPYKFSKYIIFPLL